jgi:hypothetical protein
VLNRVKDGRRLNEKSKIRRPIQAEKLEKKVALINFDIFIINRDISKIMNSCEHYFYDDAAFEQSCDCYKGIDFVGGAHCRNCLKYMPKNTKQRKIGD